MIRTFLAPALACLACTTAWAQSGPATHTLRLLTPEAAQKVVNAALQECRKQGFQVAVAVVDRSGVAQAMVRDRFAGAHTPDVAINKAWAAVLGNLQKRFDTGPFDWTAWLKQLDAFRAQAAARAAPAASQPSR